MPEETPVWEDAPCAVQALSCPRSHVCLQRTAATPAATDLHQATKTLNFQTSQFPHRSYVIMALNIISASATS